MQWSIERYTNEKTEKSNNQKSLTCYSKIKMEVIVEFNA